MSRQRLTIILLLIAVVAALGLRAAFFEVSVRAVPVLSDESIAGLQAKQVSHFHFPLLMMSQPYLFPIESYIAAPFIRWLPRNAFGARLIPALLGLLACVFPLLIMRRWGRWQDIWPGVLLVLFPSTYFMTLQVAFALPAYPSFMLFCGVVILLAQRHNEGPGSSWWYAAIAGFFAGFACSGTLMALPVLALAGLMVGLGRHWKDALVSAPLFVAGALVGLLPYFVAKMIYPGAYEAVSATVPVAAAFSKLWSPVLSYTLPITLGSQTPLFPDTKETLGLLPGCDPWVGVLWLVLLVVATAVCLVRFVARSIRQRWPTVEAADVFVGISWLCLALFLLNTRSHSHTYRYLLPLVWSFPFVVGFLYARAGRIWRVALGVVAAALVLLNAATTVAIIRCWNRPGFAESIKIYDIRPAIRYLEERGISRCVATHLDAYRITFMTDERIICSQPYNERFLGWRLPYKYDIVDPATNVAFVLTDAFRFFPKDFEKDLETMAVTCRREPCGHYFVYTDFERAKARPERKLPGASLEIVTSHCPQDARVLHDGDYATRWRSHSAQAKGMWIEIGLPAATRVNRLSMYYNYYPYDRARALKLLAMRNGKWKVVSDNILKDMDRFEFLNGHPVYGNQMQTIRFPPVRTDRLRIEIAEEEPGRDWTVGEVEVFSPAGDAR